LGAAWFTAKLEATALRPIAKLEAAVFSNDNIRGGGAIKLLHNAAPKSRTLSTEFGYCGSSSACGAAVTIGLDTGTL
jgi:hypothetical protein